MNNFKGKIIISVAHVLPYFFLALLILLSVFTSPYAKAEPVAEKSSAGGTPVGIGPNHCWGDDGLVSYLAPQSYSNCGGHTSQLPKCLFDPQTYGDEQLGTEGVYDLAAITDPNDPSLKLRILDVLYDEGSDTWQMKVSYANGQWHGNKISLHGTVLIPGASLPHAAMLAGAGLCLGKTAHHGILNPIKAGIVEMAVNEELGFRQLDYNALIKIDPELFHAIHDSHLLTDEDRDLCLTGEPGDGCIAGLAPPPGVDPLLHCATVLAAYTGNMHWSIPFVISSNQIRSRSAAEAALHSIVTTDPTNPGPEWSAYRGSRQKAEALKRMLVRAGANARTPFFERPAFFGCSKYGWAVKTVAMLEDRTVGIAPHCIPWDTVDYFQSELDEWPGGALGVDYLTGDPESSISYLESKTGQDYLKAASITPNVETFVARGIHVLFGSGANDALAPVNDPSYFIPQLWEDNPDLSLTLYTEPNAGHIARDNKAINLFLDACYSNRQLPRASMCVRYNDNGSRDIVVNMGWKGYSAAAGSAIAQLWYTHDYNGYAGAPDAAPCSEATATSGDLGDLDFRCAGYVSTAPIPVFTDPIVWTNVDELPTAGALPYRAYFVTITANIPGRNVPMAFSTPAQILEAPGNTPFRPELPGGVHACP